MYSGRIELDGIFWNSTQLMCKATKHVSGEKPRPGVLCRSCSSRCPQGRVLNHSGLPAEVPSPGRKQPQAQQCTFAEIVLSFGWQPPRSDSGSLAYWLCSCGPVTLFL